MDNLSKQKRHKTVAGAEIKTDLKLLLECLKCHTGDASVQRDTLLTTAAICSNSEEAQEFFRECGGINFVLNLLTSTEDSKVKIAALYMLGCACEKNVFSQKRLCTTAVFKFIYCQLISGGETNDSLKRTSAFLLLCLVTNNGEGQNLARTSHCLEALLKLFRSSYPTVDNTAGSPCLWLDTDTSKQLDLWTIITSTLCGCVNNPQNEENQKMCGTAAFPTAITIISKTKKPTVVRLVSSFLSLTIANNVSNQDRFGILGGMDVLVDLLHAIIEGLLRQPDQDTINAAVQLANVFVSCITDSDQNHMRLVDLHLIPLLVQLLSMDFIESDVRLKVIITLGHLTEKCERSQRQLLESDGLSLLIHMMAENQDEEFSKATMYLLSSCVDLVSCLEGEGLNTSADKDIPGRTKSADKRNKARAERDSHIPLHNGGAILKDGDNALNGDKNGELELHATNVIIASTNGDLNNSDLITPSNQNPTTETRVIDDLLRQLQEEKSTRERLENEKKALERQQEAREKSKAEAKEKAEAITKELKRQYKEQMDSQVQGGDQRQPERKCANSKILTPEKQLPYPGMKEVEQKLETLEKRIQCISNIGNQFAGHFIVANNGDQLIKGLDAPTHAMAGSQFNVYKTVLDLSSERNHHHQQDNHQQQETQHQNNLTDSTCQLPTLNPKQLCDSVNRYIRSPDDGSDIVQVSKKVDVNTTHKSSSASRYNVFRVPTCPVRRHNLGVSKLKDVNKLPLPSPNIIQRKRSRNYPSNTKSSQDDNRYESDVESCVSDITDLSAGTDTDISLSVSDMYLLKKAEATNKRLYNSFAGPKPTHHWASAGQSTDPGQSKANQNIRVNHSSEKGITFSVPSRPVSVSTQPASSHLRVGKDNTSSSKDVFTFGESQSDLSGISSSVCSNQSAFHHVPKCPGCAPPINRPLLNSRNFLYTLERCHHTCPAHRELQRYIKQDINQRRIAQKNDNSPESTRSTRSHLARNLRSATRMNRCPLPVSPGTSAGECRGETTSCSSRRRKRQEFTPQEVHNLTEGVAKRGKHWNSILWGYRFASGRTSVDLKDKYRRMQAQNYPGVMPHSPSTSCKSFKQRHTGKRVDPTWRP